MGIRAAIEADIRPIITSAANSRVVVSKVPAIHVVIGSINKTVLGPIERLTSVRIKEVASRMCYQCLSIKGRDFVDVQPRIETS